MHPMIYYQPRYPIHTDIAFDLYPQAPRLTLSSIASQIFVSSFSKIFMIKDNELTRAFLCLLLKMEEPLW